jgi:outer membrane lipoprotein-sorting protein
MKRFRVCLLAALVLAVLGRPAAAQDAREIVRAAWKHWRGTSSHGEMTMTIHRPGWERSMSMRAWTRGQKHSLVRVTAPRKDAGNGTLIIDNSMWTFSPKVNRVMKVPSSMMGQSWMGSDFSNKDVSRADTIVDQYDHTLLKEEDNDGHRVYVIESIPHEDAAVVWGKEVLRIREDDVLLEQDFYDQDGKKVKALRTLEVGEMGGRTLALRQRMEKVETEGEWTEIVLEKMRFDLDLEDRVFTLSNLRNPR